MFKLFMLLGCFSAIIVKAQSIETTTLVLTHFPNEQDCSTEVSGRRILLTKSTKWISNGTSKVITDASAVSASTSYNQTWSVAFVNDTDPFASFTLTFDETKTPVVFSTRLYTNTTAIIGDLLFRDSRKCLLIEHESQKVWIAPELEIVVDDQTRRFRIQEWNLEFKATEPTVSFRVVAKNPAQTSTSTSTTSTTTTAEVSTTVLSTTTTATTESATSTSVTTTSTSVTSTSVTSTSTPLATPIATPKPVKVLALILSFSDNGAATDVETLKAVFGDSNSQKPTVASQFRYASFGKYLVEIEVRTLRLTQHSFTAKEGSWQFTGDNCPDVNIGFHAFTSGALEEARKQQADVDSFEHHWFVMDKAQQNQKTCDFLGMGGSKRVAMKGIERAWSSIQTWMHEHAHSFGMTHSNSISSGIEKEYGDDSTAMGKGDAKQMPFSGFQAAMMTWNKPQVSLIAQEIQNTWQKVELKRMGNSDVAGLLVESTSSTTQRNFFVSLRGKADAKYKDVVQNTESPFSNEATNHSDLLERVHIQYVDGNWRKLSEAEPLPVFLAQTLKNPTDNYEDDKLGLVFQLESMGSNAETAVVRVCRKLAPTDCQK